MSRVKRGVVVKKRHKKILKQAKGFWGSRKNIFKRAKETLLRAWATAFRSRKLKKRDMRALFITRITAALKKYNISYSKFMGAMGKSDIALTRKILSQLSILDPQAFAEIVRSIQK